VLFLDIDGVLNSIPFLRQIGPFGVGIDPECMKHLKSIIKATGAKIVLTSSWREHWEKEPEKCDTAGLEINRIFASFWLSVFDKTNSFGTSRECQIEEWLLDHPEADSFAVIDDMALDSDLVRDHFVKTIAFRCGLDAEDAAEAIRILS
jgi:hypothetical protein